MTATLEDLSQSFFYVCLSSSWTNSKDTHRDTHSKVYLNMFHLKLFSGMMRFILLHGKYKKEGKERKQHRSLARKSSAKVFNAKLIINLNVQ